VGEALHLYVAFVPRQPMREVAEVEAVADKGFQGCVHGRPGNKRQVLLMDIETLEALGVEPGRVKENITTRGLKVQELTQGQRLRVGEALLEVTGPCKPCHLMNEIRPNLEQDLRGRRGMLCRVLESGQIRRGDQVEVLEAAVAPI
jgi:MOSC domain-containing protein YiiM